MRLNVFLIALLFISFGLLGQTEKGNFLIGGTGSIGNLNETTDFPGLTPNISVTKITSISLTPNLSYFVVARLAVGVQTGYSYTNEKITQGTSADQLLKGHTLSVGPQVILFSFWQFSGVPTIELCVGLGNK